MASGARVQPHRRTRQLGSRAVFGFSRDLACSPKLLVELG